MKSESFKRNIDTRLERAYSTKANKIFRLGIATIQSLSSERRFNNEDRPIEEMHELKQSVLEHMGGMHVLATFILDQDPDATLDVDVVHKMIVLHDIEETITGDHAKKGTKKKEQEMYAEQALKDLAQKVLPESTLVETYEKYEHRESPEAQFVKGLDMLEVYLTVIAHERYDVVDDIKWEVSPDLEKVSPLLYEISQLAVQFMHQKRAAWENDQEK